MKFLQKHGKKVSVCLLALAVMITPMLQAAAANSCPEKKKILLFSDAEVMAAVAFDSDLMKKENKENDEYGYMTYENGGREELIIQSQSQKKLGDSMVQALFHHNDYVINVYCPGSEADGEVTFADTTICAKATNGEPEAVSGRDGIYKISYDKSTTGDDNFLKDIYRPNATLMHFTKQMTDMYGWGGADWLSALTNAGYADSIISVFDQNNGKISDKSSKLSVSGWNLRSLTYFNNSIPIDATIINEEVSNEWDDSDVDADIQLELLNYEKINNERNCDDLAEYAVNDTTSYVMHGDWLNFGEDANEGTCKTLEAGKIQYEKNLSGGDFDRYKEVYKKALLNGSSTSIKFTSTVLDSGAPGWQAIVDRIGIKANDSTNSAIKSLTTTTILPENSPWHSYPYGNEIKYWVYVPAKYTITYQDAECAVDTADTVDKSNEGNPGTGIVSYALIGTLLVGAASAYIYARKSNKFNKI